MNYSIIRYVLGWSVTVIAALMLLPALVSALYREKTVWVFLVCAAVFFCIGRLLGRKKPKNTVFYAREGFTAVALCWIAISVISAVPFIAGGAITNPVDALFETVSGYTTTGSSILENVEALSRGMLFWRSFTHWIGGMGVLVFVLAILPSAGGQNMYIMQAESPGPDVGKLLPNLKKTAIVLYLIYAGLTGLEFALLAFGNMPLFDALCVTFGTAGTGGFGVLNDSCASYSNYEKIVITVFMALFGVNFNFYFLLLSRKIKEAFNSAEVKVYFAIMLSSIALITFGLWRSTGGFRLLDAAFQTSSIMTTTGFTTVNYDGWPLFTRVILVALMFVGACAGSTGGGIKISRLIIYAKVVKREFSRMLHPRRVKVITIDGKPVNTKIINTSLCFFVSYVAVFALSVLLVSIDAGNFETAFTSVAATLNNIGPGLGAVGPAGNFAGFSAFSKIVLIFDMLAGRLEIFPLLLTFIPASWRN